MKRTTIMTTLTASSTFSLKDFLKSFML